VTPYEQPEFERDRLPLIHPGEECEHLCDIDRLARPRAEACEECGMERTLRVCLSCGHVGCCESWRGHASAHAEETGHRSSRRPTALIGPVIGPEEPRDE